MKPMLPFKNCVLIALLFLGMAPAATAQTWDDVQNLLWNEQNDKAKETLKALVAGNPADAELNYRMGNLLYSEGKKDSARIYYNKGIKPEDKVNYNFAGLGKLALDEGNTTAAIDYFNKLTVKDKTKDAKAFIFVGEAYLNASKKQTDLAVTTFKKALVLDKNSIEAYLLLGDAYLASNNAGTAITNYEFAYEKHGKLAVAYNNIGKIYITSRNYNEAREHFKKANEIDPAFIPVYRELAELYHLAKQHEEAVKMMDQYLALSGNNDLETQSRYASFVFLAKDYPKTISLIEELMRKDNSNVIWSRLIGYSYYEQGKYPEGLAQLENFFAKVDTSKVIASDYTYYARLLSKTGKDSLAVDNFNKAILEGEPEPELYDELAVLLMTQKRYFESAEAYKQKMLVFGKSTSQDYFQIGRAYYYGANYQGADSAFAKVNELQPTAAIGFLWRARVASQLDPESTAGLALPHYEKFVELAVDATKYKKELIEANSYLGYYYFLKKDSAKAKTAWLKVKELDPANAKADEFLKNAK